MHRNIGINGDPFSQGSTLFDSALPRDYHPYGMAYHGIPTASHGVAKVPAGMPPVVLSQPPRQPPRHSMETPRHVMATPMTNNDTPMSKAPMLGFGAVGKKTKEWILSRRVVFGTRWLVQRTRNRLEPRQTPRVTRLARNKSYPFPRNPDPGTSENYYY